MRLRVSDLEMALCAISIQSRAAVRKSRGGCAVSTDDEDRLTPLRNEVKRQDRDLGIRLGPDGRRQLHYLCTFPIRGMR
jgi:hypothetical protein